MSATTLTDRAVVRLSGEGVRDFLQGLVTSDIEGPLPAWTGLLTPQGKCLFDFFVWPSEQGAGEDVLLDCEAAAADDLIKRLSIYRLRRPITITRDVGLAVHWSPDGADDPRLPELGRRWIAAIPPLDSEGRGTSVAGGGATSAYLEHRLRLGVCEGRAELADLLWLECNAAELNGVSFSKGCFVGQENTARMNWRSKVNRRLLVIETGETGPRTRIAYPSLGLAVEHRRLDDLTGAIIPEWLQVSWRA
jgi:folate-binding protein YgfZ